MATQNQSAFQQLIAAYKPSGDSSIITAAVQEREAMVAALREAYREIGGKDAARYGHKGLGEQIEEALAASGISGS